MNKKILIIIGITIFLLFIFTERQSRHKLNKTPNSSATTTETLPTKGMNLSQAKVALLYERISDGITFDRSADDLVKIINETNADLVLRSFFRWQPVPDSTDSTMQGYPSNYVKQAYSRGYTYQQYSEAIKIIKAERPDILIIGAIAAQHLNRIEFNDMTHESFTQAQTWEMAFDPTKYGLSSKLGTKEEIQCRLAKGLGWIDSNTKCPIGYDAESTPVYFPDITNEQYQNLLLSYAEKQIDLGADGVWIDMLYSQAAAIMTIIGKPDDPAVKISYDAASKLIDDIHAYGYSKYNKHIYVGTWSTFAEMPFSPPSIDFVTVSPKPNEITGGLDEERWNTMKSTILAKMGNIPIFAFIDWSAEGSPMDVFSQDLTPEQQRSFIRTADTFFIDKGIIFAYPVHGGTFPNDSIGTRLSFGKYGGYDSLAPEFQTYGTIKELAQKKASK